MGPDVLAMLIPIVAIGGAFGVAAFKVWIAHREKIETLRLQQSQHQAEFDRQFLGMGDPTTQNAHLNVILDRLVSIEKRLDGLDGSSPAAIPAPPQVQPAAMPLNPIPLTPIPPATTTPPGSESPERRRQTNIDNDA